LSEAAAVAQVEAIVPRGSAAPSALPG